MSLPMTHATAFSRSAFANEHERDEIRIRQCHASLTFLYNDFHSDVSWRVYRCNACSVDVYAVGGHAHQWNYETPIKERVSP